MGVNIIIGNFGGLTKMAIVQNNGTCPSVLGCWKMMKHQKGDQNENIENITKNNYYYLIIA